MRLGVEGPARASQRTEGRKAGRGLNSHLVRSPHQCSSYSDPCSQVPAPSPVASCLIPRNSTLSPVWPMDPVPWSLPDPGPQPPHLPLGHSAPGASETGSSLLLLGPSCLRTDPLSMSSGFLPPFSQGHPQASRQPSRPQTTRTSLHFSHLSPLSQPKAQSHVLSSREDELHQRPQSPRLGSVHSGWFTNVVKE